MSNTIIEKLLDGAEVEWKALDKVIEKTENIKWTNNKESYQYIDLTSVDKDSKKIVETITIDATNAPSRAQKLVYAGDVIFATTRPTQMRSTIIDAPYDGQIASSGYCVLRANREIVLPEWIFFNLQKKEFKQYLENNESGSAYPAISDKKLKEFIIPIPPLSIQKKIVKTLDKFTELEATLEATLEAELALRKKQHQYYRETLLTFPQDLDRGGYNAITQALHHSGKVVFRALGEMGELIRGNGLQKKDFTESGVPAIHYGQIYTYYGTFADKTKSFVSSEVAKKLKKAQKGDVLIAGTSENIQDVMKPLGWLGNEIVFSGDMFAFRSNEKLDTKYLTYLLQTEHFSKYKEKYAQGTKVIRLNSSNFLKYEIPVLSLDEQQKIVAILDKFDQLTNSISEGLPKEIALRRKQYEYYREQLLDFPKS